MQRIDSKNLPRTLDILRWSIKEDFSGYDPYDGLNLPILNDFHFLRKRYLMILITQFFKNLPVNLRPILGIKKERNAKGIALFASGLLNLYKKEREEKYLRFANKLLDWLKDNRSPYSKNFAWGYNFPWQSRNSYKPKYYPNIVTTSFVARCFLNAYEQTGKNDYLDIAASAGDFIIEELNIYEDERGICFSYSPADNERVYNATFLASWILFEIWKLTNDNGYLKYGEKSIEFGIQSQNQDGSWYYGDNKNQKWIDNFHTGYNLWSLYEIYRITEEEKIKKSIDRGMEYYLNNLFDEDMLPYYYPHSRYPLDIHSFAVGIILFSRMGKKETALRIFRKAIELLYSGRGYFYFRKMPLYTIKIPYMRWSNAWIFYAMTEIEKNENLD